MRQEYSDSDGSDTPETYLFPTPDAQKQAPRSTRPSSDSESHPHGRVLTQQAANLIYHRRNEAAENMSRDRPSSSGKKKHGNESSRGRNEGSRGRRSRSPPRHSSERRRSHDCYSGDSEDSGDRRRDSRGNPGEPDLLAQIAELQKSLNEERQKLNQERQKSREDRQNFQLQLDSATAKKRTKHASMIPFDQNLLGVIDEVVRTILWRDTKFMVNNEQKLEATETVMRNIPQVKDKYCMDPTTRDANIAAFNTTCGDEIVKSLNNRRTEAQGSVQKAHEKRYRSGALMPTAQRMLEVILRKGMSPGATNILGEEVTADYAEENVELFTWYWDKVLIAVCGMARWSHSHKYFAIPSKGKDMTTKAKFVNSGDEAMIALIFENCGQRFPHLTSLINSRETKDISLLPLSSKIEKPT